MISYLFYLTYIPLCISFFLGIFTCFPIFILPYSFPLTYINLLDFPYIVYLDCFPSRIFVFNVSHLFSLT